MGPCLHLGLNTNKKKRTISELFRSNEDEEISALNAHQLGISSRDIRSDEVVNENTWICTFCTFRNHEDLSVCEICEKSRAER